MTRIPPGEIQALLDHVKKVLPWTTHPTQTVRAEDAARAVLHGLRLANTAGLSGGGLLQALQMEIDRTSAKSQMRQKEDSLS